MTPLDMGVTPLDRPVDVGCRKCGATITIDAVPIIPISDTSIVRHEDDEVFWFVRDPDPTPLSFGWLNPWVCHGSWIKESFQ